MIHWRLNGAQTESRVSYGQISSAVGDQSTEELLAFLRPQPHDRESQELGCTALSMHASLDGILERLGYERGAAVQTFRNEFLKLVVWTVPAASALVLMKWIADKASQALLLPNQATIAGQVTTIGMIVAIAFVAFGAAVQWRRYRYSRDEFFGVEWTWSYSIDGRITRVRGWCPVCHREIRFRTGAIAALQTDNFLCSNCSYDSFSRVPPEKIPRPTFTAVIRRVEEKRLLRRYGWKQKT